MKNRRSPSSFVDPRSTWTRHRLALFGGILALCFSVGTASTLMNLTYFADSSDEFATGAFFIGSATTCALFGIAQSAVLHGYAQWVWLQAGVFMIYFLAVLPTAIYSPDRILFTLAVLSPLIGLLFINGKRQREMRGMMLELRHKREHIVSTLKKQGKWHGW
ncbi:hypothetical protein [Pseudomonas sp. CBZ-4]|uniref:hypothetical protein n=1 Tax=Pseudomonas sp. CBZ-4 TaxID=1163065 RepID=UPI00037D9DB5|nr:hypothetical protein [Pseudomonas sp. CBZ-4]